MMKQYSVIGLALFSMSVLDSVRRRLGVRELCILDLRLLVVCPRILRPRHWG